MLFLPYFQCYFYHIFNAIFTIFSMHILPLKNVLLKITLEDFKNNFWRSILKIYLMVSPYRWRCLYISPYWRSFSKIIFFQIFKKNLEIIFLFLFFFKKKYFSIFKILRIDLQNDFWEKKVFVSSEIRTCDPWLASSALCLCATWLVMKGR